LPLPPISDPTQAPRGHKLAEEDGDGLKPAAENQKEAEAEQGKARLVRMGVLAQYVKDLSFESPGAPQSLQNPGPNPRLDVSFDVHAGGIGQDLYEVSFGVKAQARSDQGTVYDLELLYGGMFRLENVPQERLQPILFIDCAALLFPFARRLVADLTRDGGFPPLMLDPIDFGALYARNIANAQAEATGAPKN
jgi:preprotein translocase subunit SecB